MLRELLHLLQEGGTRRIAELADELGTTPQLVEAMLDDLARLGYVKRMASQCSERCTTCPMSEMCAAGGPSGGGSSGQIWVLSGKHNAI